MNRTSSFLACGLLLSQALLASGPVPTTVIPLRPSEIAKAAEQVVVGTVLSSQCRFAPNGFGIQTLVTLGDLSVQKGSVLTPTLTLEFMGGQVGDRKQVVHDMPELQVGKRYLLYVEGNGKYASPVVGFWQGAFEIRTDNGREVLVNLKGEQLVGIRDDRFVFAQNGNQPGALAPETATTGRTHKAAPDNHAQEAALEAKKANETRLPAPVPELPAKTDRNPAPAPVDVPVPATPKLLAPATKAPSEAGPIYLAQKDDRGERISLGSLLTATR